MRILVTGGSGFVGQRLCERLHQAGHELLVVSRRPEKARSRLPQGTRVHTAVMDFADSWPQAIINLAGESIAAKRWSEAQKRRLVESRLGITSELVRLCQRLHGQGAAPAVLISGSAMGYYGDQGEREVCEATPPHDEFAHRLCARWEAVAQEASEQGVRVALLRTGLVLDQGGGSLAKMLPPFKLGLGGRFGDGRQFMPWIHREDLVRAIEFLLERDDLSGPFNGSAPHPVRNAEFTHCLAHHLHRPTPFPVPAALLKAALGEMSQLLLSGADMRPARLEQAGFTFRYPTLDEALEAILA
ncbi:MULTISPECIES: TIGR01777 family oxidoreductase [Halomonadaceae]|uniref:TIGR01777 family oxidoreductase n=1 Tax=Halomonadaceae TaxID=28256 RepID=UPI0015984784|nr:MULTISPECIES: TIGR01777 family oxidoreductase [Halomonas]QJQ96001.1 TIGR01777 family protein [Halomonas sp. PA5]